jgi:hypothetical protein
VAVTAGWFAYDSATVRAVAGTGVAGTSGDGGPAASAAINIPTSLTADGDGNVYVCETGAYGVRRIAADGTITRFAGNGTAGFSGDGGQADAAQLNNPRGVAFHAPSGAFYIADTGNARIRRVGSDGVITTVAGTGGAGYTGDGGPGTSATLNTLREVAVDTAGNVYMADAGNRVIRRLGADGVITTVAGTGVSGSSGDGGPATAAQIRNPTGIAVSADGVLYIVDRDSHRIRKVSTGVITTVAGTGTAGSGGDGGPGTAAGLNLPNDVHLDAAGSLYISDGGNHRVRRVDPTGVIVTVAGTGAAGSTGDGGPALSATFQDPRALTIATDGHLYISDRNANVVRRLEH